MQLYQDNANMISNFFTETYLVEIILIAFSTFLLRFKSASQYSSDDINTTQRIRNNYSKIFINYHNSQSLFTGFNGNPNLQYWLLSKMPGKSKLLYGRYANILYDFLSALAIYYFINLIFFFEISIFFSYGFYTAIIFVTHPSLIPLTERMAGVKARSLGALLSYVCLILFYFILENNQFLSKEYLILISFIFLLLHLAILSGAMGMQVIIFFLFSLSLVYSEYFFIVLLTIYIVSGCLFDFLGIKKVLIHKINHYWWYYKSFKDSPAQDKIFNFKLIKDKNIKSLVSYLFTRSISLSIIYSIPSLFVLYTTWFYNNNFTNPLLLYSICILAISIFISILTSFWPFAIFGDGERYQEYSAGFVFLPVIYFEDLTSIYSFLIILIFNLLINTIFYLIRKKREKILASKKLVTDNNYYDEIQILDFLKKQDDVRAVHCYPTKNVFAFLSHDKKYDFIKFFIPHTSIKLDGFQKDLEIQSHYNVPKKDINILRKYFTHFIIPKSFMSEINQDEFIEWLLQYFSIIFKNNKYIILKINNID